MGTKDARSGAAGILEPAVMEGKNQSLGAAGNGSKRSRKKGASLTEYEMASLEPGEKLTDGGKPFPGGGGGRLIARGRAGKPDKAGGTRTIREFYFRYRTAGRDRLMYLGRYGGGRGALTLPAARDHAAELSRQLSEGKDPQVQREIKREENKRDERLAKEQIAAERRRGTLEDLLAAYVAHLRQQGKACARDAERTFKQHVVEPFSDLASKAAKEVTPGDISTILAKMIAKNIHRRSNITRSYLRAAFAFGAGVDNDPRRKAEALQRLTKGATAEQSENGSADQGDSISKEYGLTSNPVALVRRQADFDRASDRVLTDAELRAYMKALQDQARDPAIHDALWAALLLGGQRLSQLLRAQWADYDKEEGILRLIDKKGRGGRARVHLLPVSATVAEALERLHALNRGGSFIFSTQLGKTSIDVSTLSRHASEIGRAASEKGTEPFTAADIRRTVETRLAALGVTKEHRAQLLSHGRESDVQARHYDRHDYIPEKAAALAKWEAHLGEIAEGKSVKVIRGRFGRMAAHPRAGQA